MSPTRPARSDADLRAAHEAALDLARVAAGAADEKAGEQTMVLDVGAVLAITDAFVIASAGNKRLVRTIAEHIEEVVRQRLERSPLRTEGFTDLQWVLLDYGDVVVHVFTDETRRFYEIERLYRDVPVVAWERDPAPQ
mgnify:CR=1 FL=1